MKEKERLLVELKKAKEELEQQEFFVHWLESQIRVIEMKELLKNEKKNTKI